MCSNELKDLLGALEIKTPIAMGNEISYMLTGRELLACKVHLRQLAQINSGLRTVDITAPLQPTSPE